MATAAMGMSAGDLLGLADDHQRHELIRGELVTMDLAGFEHGVIAARLGRIVDAYVADNNLGVVTSSETGFKIESDPDTVRAPDMAFVRRNRIPPGNLPSSYFNGAPDLAAEVLSPNDSYGEIQRKVTVWLVAGSRLV